MRNTLISSKLFQPILGLIFAAAFGMSANPGYAAVATNLVIIAPGETFTAGSGKTGIVKEQIHGLPFSATVISVDENNQYKTSYAMVDLSAGNGVFSPDPQLLNQTFGNASGSGYSPFQFKLSPGTNSNVVVNAHASETSGITDGTVTIPIKYMAKVDFTLPSSWIAGEKKNIIVKTTDGANVVPYTGTAKISALSGGVNGVNTGNLGTINFAEGIGNVDVTLTYAGSGIKLLVQNLSPDPGTITIANRTSAAFNVAAGAPAKWLIVHEDQTILSGSSSGGSGRSGTIGTESANESFKVKVYATDDYWNIVNSSATAALNFEEDPGWGGSIVPASQVAGTGVVFTVKLRRVMDGDQTLAANGSTLINNQLAVPIKHSVLNQFAFSEISNPQLVGQNISLKITAYDSWGNTVNSAGAITGTISLAVKSGGTIFDQSSFSVNAISGSEFDNDGNWTKGDFKIYRKGNSIAISAVKDTITNSSNTFDVNLNSALSSRYVVSLLPQSYAPGELHDNIWGRTNEKPNAIKAGSKISAAIYVCDFYGNKLTGPDGNRTVDLSLNIADANATPLQVIAAEGTANLNLLLTKATDQQIITASGGGISTAGISHDFTVSNALLDHFSLQATPQQDAGGNYKTKIQAEDIYNNPATDFNSTVYFTCPALDYANPIESVIFVENGSKNYTSTANWNLTGGFTSGARDINIKIFRATTIQTGKAKLFVSTVASDTPENHSGKIGGSAEIDIATGDFSKVIALVPGMNYRPGADGSGANTGYDGTPFSPLVDSEFQVKAYACDAYWNCITHVTASFQVDSNNPPQTKINGYACPWNTSFTNGEKTFNAKFTDGGNYYLEIDASSINFTTPKISVYSFDHFTFTRISGGTDFQNWKAGEPKVIKITAYATADTIAESFSGPVELKYSEDYEGHLKTISPKADINFTGGTWQGEIKLFRADTNSQLKYINAMVGNKAFPSNPVKVSAGDPKKMLIVMDSMTVYPGLNPQAEADAIQGELITQTAGTPIPEVIFYLCDDYWNVVTGGADANGAKIEISSSDGEPYPAKLGNLALPQNATLNSGKYVASGGNAITLFNVYNPQKEARQTLTVTHEKGYGPFTLGGPEMGAIKMKHAKKMHAFNFTIDPQILSNGATAGQPFAVTISAVDEYENTMDDANGAAAFENNPVNLSTNTDIGGRSMWPYIAGNIEITKWINGQCKPWVYAYKKSASNISIKADYNGLAGTSAGFHVNAGGYARLIPLLDGMALSPDDSGAGGIYTADYLSRPPEADPAVFNNFGTNPVSPRAGDPVQIKVYSCDLFGNVVKQKSTEVHLSSSDRFAPNVPNAAVNPAEGYAVFNDFQFHSQGKAAIRCDAASESGILSGTTPALTVLPGLFYGLQIITPGQTAVEGSGLPGIIWYSGVTPTEPWVRNVQNYSGRAQFKGNYFTVLVKAADKFGNFIGSESPAHDIELRSDDSSQASEPGIEPVTFLNKGLQGGRASFQCQLRSTGYRHLKPYDLTNSSMKGGDESYSLINIVENDKTNFYVTVNGVAPGNNVALTAAPELFTVRIEVHYTQTGEIIATAQPFIMEAMRSDLSGLANGTLGLSSSITDDGVAEIPNQTYTKAEKIYIKVRNVDGSDKPEPGYSPQLQVSPSAPAKIILWSDVISYSQGSETYYQIQANKDARIYTEVLDRNDNPVIGQSVTMQIQNLELTNSRLEAPETGVTDANGIAFKTFYAGASNLKHSIQASTADGISGLLNMLVTVTQNGGVYPNPFNPLRGQATHIDYFLEKDAEVKIALFTLTGKLVWEEILAKGDPAGGHKGINSVLWFGKNGNGVTVANGGYICLIKADGQEKCRFKIGVFKE